MALYAQETLDNINRTRTAVVNKTYVSINGNQYIGVEGGFLKFISPKDINHIIEPVDIGASALPIGAATEAKQDVGNTLTANNSRYGSYTSTFEVSSIGSSVLILEQDNTRKIVYITNFADKPMYVCYFNPATLKSPIVLRTNDTLIEDVYQGEIYARWAEAPTGEASITSVRQYE
tara:strand:+ start:49 stop:576 length:528 start_codon:yes stop_codon:yes gene_type:complete